VSALVGYYWTNGF